jgi:hypothetical protein
MISFVLLSTLLNLAYNQYHKPFDFKKINKVSASCTSYGASNWR